jgi:hypothetical protein
VKHGLTRNNGNNWGSDTTFIHNITTMGNKVVDTTYAYATYEERKLDSLLNHVANNKHTKNVFTH